MSFRELPAPLDPRDRLTKPGLLSEALLSEPDQFRRRLPERLQSSEQGWRGKPTGLWIVNKPSEVDVGVDTTHWQRRQHLARNGQDEMSLRSEYFAPVVSAADLGTEKLVAMLDDRLIRISALDGRDHGQAVPAGSPSDDLVEPVEPKCAQRAL